MKKILVTLLLAVSLFTVTAQENYTVIVSCDGLRWDYLETFDVPFMDKMADQGVKAVMMPSFPSKTFPNHYTLATGLYPDHHGIIANTFWDRENQVQYSMGDRKISGNPDYYGGEPIWLTAKRQGLNTACIFWVGSDVKIDGEYATYWHDYQTEAEKMDFTARADEVVKLLQLPYNERPQLIMLYFEEPDHSGHMFGPMNYKTRQAMEDIDMILENMWDKIQTLSVADSVNLIVTGDHGMTQLSSERYIDLKDYLNEEWIEKICNDYPTLIYAKDKKYIKKICNALKDIDHIRVWTRDDIPEYLNYGSNENIGDVIVLPDIGWHFGSYIPKNQGSHGFDNTASDMWVGFRAMGPDFKVGYKKDLTFRNVSIYPLLCYLLNVSPSPNDGDLDEVKEILKNTK